MNNNNYKNKNLLDLIKKHFKTRIQARVDWNSREILAQFEDAFNDALVEYIDA